MSLDRLEALGATRRLAKAQADEAYRNLLDAVVDYLGEAGADAAAAARKSGIARATIYNELARRQTTRDELEGADHPPPPGPADEDPTANGRLELSASQRRGLVELAEGKTLAAGNMTVSRRTIDGLRRRGLIKRESLDLTPAGEAAAEDNPERTE